MYFIDVQGTIIKDIDKSPIDGAIEFIDKLNSQKIPYLIITNNTKKSSKSFFEFLVGSGFNISQERYLDPLMVVKDIVKESQIAIYGQDEFIENILELGYTLNFESPEVVLISVKKEYTHEEYAQIIEFLLSGAKLIGMHETTLYATGGKRYPGVGAVLKMLSYATGVDYTIVGKPSVAFYEEAKKMIDAKDYRDITIISDDLKGDLVGAKELGMKTIFVLSGKYNHEDEIIPTIAKEYHPDNILQSIKEVIV